MTLAPLRPYRTTDEERLIAKLRRDERRAAGDCVNGAAHGKASHGVRCRGCAISHGGYRVLP